MVGTDSLALEAEKVNGFWGTEVGLDANRWQYTERRLIRVHNKPDLCVNWSLDLNVSLGLINGSRVAFNEAEVFLLPEELPIFTQALIEHPILFPISYSQHLSMERGIHCLRLSSQEPPEDFAERLSGALRVLE